MILFFIHLFSLLFHVKEEVSVSNLEKNRKVLIPRTGDGYIERQDLLKELCYGAQSNFLSDVVLKGQPLSGDKNSCGLLAVYNVLSYYGKKRQLADIVWDFEKQGASLRGYFGTSIKRVEEYLSAAGFYVSPISVSLATTEAAGAFGKVAYIITGLNEKGRITSKVHIICLTREGNLLRAHNDVTGGRMYPTLADACTDFGNGRGSVLRILRITS